VKKEKDMKRLTKSLGIASVAAAVTALGPAVFADDFRWQGRLPAGKTVEVKGVNGGIDAEAASGNEVEVFATKKARRSNPASVEVKLLEHDGGVTVCAVYPTRGGSANTCEPGEGGHMEVRDNDVQVDFRVKVPAGVHFVGRTVNGGIEARRLPSDAAVYTVNGGIDVDAAGLVRASTVNGGINAAVGRADWEGDLEFRTVNGGITLALPEDVGAEVRASTVNGGIETDFPLTVRGKFNRRRVNGTLGGGGRELSLETVNGSIELRKAR
jgi:hypothetical protein